MNGSQKEYTLWILPLETVPLEGKSVVIVQDEGEKLTMWIQTCLRADRYHRSWNRKMSVYATQESLDRPRRFVLQRCLR